MANLDDVRQIVSELPGAIEAEGEQYSVGVLVRGKLKGFCWSWRERVDPKKAKVVNDSVLAVRVSNLTAKELLIGSNPDVYFTEPHYNGFPAVLVRLELIGLDELEDVLREAWATTQK